MSVKPPSRIGCHFLREMGTVRCHQCIIYCDAQHGRVARLPRRSRELAHLRLGEAALLAYHRSLSPQMGFWRHLPQWRLWPTLGGRRSFSLAVLDQMPLDGFIC